MKNKPKHSDCLNPDGIETVQPSAGIRLNAASLTACLLVTLLAFFVSTASAQIGGTFKGFKLLDYYDEPIPGKSPVRSLKSQITGGEAQTEASGIQRVTKGVRIENYLANGETNLTATAPDCLVDPKTRTAYSASQLQVQTAGGQLMIQGQGFFYQQTNFNLLISNQIETTIHQELLRSTNALASPLPYRARTNAPAGSNDVIKIFSQNFSLESSSNLALYTGGVRVADPQMELTCETLTLRRASNGPIERINAERDVTVTNKQDQSYATGDQAVYSLEPDREQIVLSGHQAHWQDFQREAKAGVFTFDRPANILHADQQPWMKLPGSSVGQPDWLAGGSLATNGPPQTNHFVEITAQQMALHLPSTNQPSRRITAQASVVLTNSADNSRATADRMVYDDATAIVELDGHAVWESEQRLIKGETLILDRSNKVFSARGNAYFKAPLSTFSRTTPLASAPHGPSIAEALEVFSDNWTYQPALFSFNENVHAHYFQGETNRANLICRSLTVSLNSNRLETLMAQGAVALDEPPVGTNPLQRIERKLNCENLTVHFYTNGLIQNIFAQTNVLAQQDETRPSQPRPIHTELAATTANMLFFAHTNQVKEIVAEQNVSIVQADKRAYGERAVYLSTRQELELTGHPTAEMPLGRITHAQVLVWDQAHNTLHARASGTNVVAEGDSPGKWSASQKGPLFRKRK